MVKLKLMFKIIYAIAVVLSLVYLTGCGSTPQIIETEIKVPFETTIHDTIILRETVINKDSIWTGALVDSLNNEIGWLKVYHSKKIAELKLNKRDTVTIIDTITISTNNKNLLPVIAGSLSWWEQLILYGGIGAILSLLIAIRFKRGKI